MLPEMIPERKVRDFTPQLITGMVDQRKTFVCFLLFLPGPFFRGFKAKALRQAAGIPTRRDLYIKGLG